MHLSTLITEVRLLGLLASGNLFLKILIRFCTVCVSSQESRHSEIWNLKEDNSECLCWIYYLVFYTYINQLLICFVNAILFIKNLGFTKLSHIKKVEKESYSMSSCMNIFSFWQGFSFFIACMPKDLVHYCMSLVLRDGERRWLHATYSASQRQHEWKLAFILCQQ